jgi:hypothetical protein
MSPGTIDRVPRLFIARLLVANRQKVWNIAAPIAQPRPAALSSAQRMNDPLASEADSERALGKLRRVLDANGE